MRGKVYEALAGRLVVGLAGTEPTDGERGILRTAPPAGIILFDRNVESARQLRALTDELRALVRAASGLDPIIAADHEGGRISVLARAVGVPPSQMAIGRIADGGLREAVCAETAARMLDVGVGMILGPVADVNTEHGNPVIGTRSYGEEGGLVSSLVAEAVGALARGGLATCVKHFPGHGSSRCDSHLDLPELGRTIDELEALDLVPFARGIAAGADAIMTGHVVPKGRSLPASIDPGLIGPIVRERWGFDGVVMTDALEMEGAMRAVRGAGPEEQSPGLLSRLLASAMLAGNDILLFSRPLEEAAAAIGGCPAPPHDPADAQSRRRIEALRRRMAVWEPAAGRPDGPAAGGAGYGQLERPAREEQAGTPRPYRAVADLSVSVAGMVRGAGGGMRFFGRREDFENRPVRRFIERLRRGGGGARIGSPEGRGVHPAPAGPVPVEGTDGEILRLEAGRGEAETAVLLFRRPLDPGILAALAAGAPNVVVAGWPYAAELLDARGCTIVTFGPYDAAGDVVGETLAGGGRAERK